MKSILTGLFAFACVLATGVFQAQAGSGTIAYKPGAVKAAVAKGQTVLIHYKSTW